MPSLSRLFCSSCSIAFRESPPEFGFDSSIWKYPFVATTVSSRCPSSASPRTRSDSPSEYMLAVLPDYVWRLTRSLWLLVMSKNVTPSSSARSTIAFPSDSSSTHSRHSGSPKLMQPRQIFDTVMPVSPSVVYSIRGAGVQPSKKLLDGVGSENSGYWNQRRLDAVLVGDNHCSLRIEGRARRLRDTVETRRGAYNAWLENIEKRKRPVEEAVLNRHTAAR